MSNPKYPSFPDFHISDEAKRLETERVFVPFQKMTTQCQNCGALSLFTSNVKQSHYELCDFDNDAMQPGCQRMAMHLYLQDGWPDEEACERLRTVFRRATAGSPGVHQPDGTPHRPTEIMEVHGAVAEGAGAGEEDRRETPAPVQQDTEVPDQA